MSFSQKARTCDAVTQSNQSKRLHHKISKKVSRRDKKLHHNHLHTIVWMPRTPTWYQHTYMYEDEKDNKLMTCFNNKIIWNWALTINNFINSPWGKINFCSKKINNFAYPLYMRSQQTNIDGKKKTNDSQYSTQLNKKKISYLIPVYNKNCCQAGNWTHSHCKLIEEIIFCGSGTVVSIRTNSRGKAYTSTRGPTVG